MYKIVFEAFAKVDLADIFSFYLLQGGLELATTSKDRIQNQINKLKQSPSIYQNSPLEPRLKQLLLNKMPYKVYFLVNEETSTVHVIRILHTARDHKSIFEEILVFED